MNSRCFCENVAWEFKKIKYQEKPGFILCALKYIFTFLYLLSPAKWISGTIKKQRMVTSGNFRPYTYTEIYVVAAFVIEFIMLCILCHYNCPNISSNPIPSGILLFIFSFRLLDIFQSWVSQFVLSYHWNAVNANRSLILAFEGYIEIAMIGAIVRLIFEKDSPVSNSVYSLIANPQIADVSPIQYIQIIFSILFVTVVIQQVVARISNR